MNTKKVVVLCLSLFVAAPMLYGNNISSDLERIQRIEAILKQTEENILQQKAARLPSTQGGNESPFLIRKLPEFRPDINIHSFFTFDIDKDTPYESDAFHYIEANISFAGELSDRTSYALSFKNIYNYYKDHNSTSDPDISLDELYLTYKGDTFEISAGKRAFTWGKLDEFFILDIVNPQDFGQFFFLSKNDRKIPVWALAYTYYTSWDNMASFKFIFIPKTKPNRWHYFGHDYAIFDHLKEKTSKTLGSPLNAVIDNISVNNSKTGFALDNSDFLIKASYILDYFDLDFIYMYKLDNQALLFPRSGKGSLVLDMLYNPSDTTLNNLLSSSPNDNDLILDEKRKRLNIFGLSAEGTIWDMGWRYEGAIILNKYWVSDNGMPVERDAFAQGFGLDNQRTDFYYNIQLLHQRVFNYSPLYRQGRDTFTVSTQMYWQSKYGKWKVGLDTAINLEYKDWFLNPYLTYSNLKGLKHTLGLQLFNGPPGTVFGTFKNKDVVYLETEADF